MENVLVVDLLAYPGADPGTFSVRELSIVCLDTFEGTHFFFNLSGNTEDLDGEPPQLALDLLHCDNGPHAFDACRRHSKAHPKGTVYCYGSHKAVWLEWLLERPVYDLKLFLCPPLEDLKERVKAEATFCRRHEDDNVCTRFSAHAIAAWISENPSLVDLCLYDNRCLTFIGWGTGENPDPLARSGFALSTARSSVVRCIFCGMSESGNTPIKDILRKHKINLTIPHDDCVLSTDDEDDENEDEGDQEETDESSEDISEACDQNSAD